ncbi:MAG TPA: histidine phosphatase family protein [Polyangiales bacterium]
MGILLVRHSDAVSETGAIDDAARWLTPRGRARALASARALAGRGLSFDRFVASPRVRAVQTAELYAQVLGFAGPVECLPALSFTEPAQDAVTALSGLAGNVAAFGHMPTLADIVRALGHENQARALATSEAVWIDAGRVVFRLPPSD